MFKRRLLQAIVDYEFFFLNIFVKGWELQKSERWNLKMRTWNVRNLSKDQNIESLHLKWSEHWKIRTTTTYGVLPRDTKACGG